jgi:hypothetical protein
MSFWTVQLIEQNPLGTVVERLDRFGTHAHPVQVVPSVVMRWGTHVNFLLNPLTRTSTACIGVNRSSLSLSLGC